MNSTGYEFQYPRGKGTRAVDDLGCDEFSRLFLSSHLTDILSFDTDRFSSGSITFTAAYVCNDDSEFSLIYRSYHLLFCSLLHMKK